MRILLATGLSLLLLHAGGERPVYGQLSNSSGSGTGGGGLFGSSLNAGFSNTGGGGMGGGGLGGGGLGGGGGQLGGLGGGLGAGVLTLNQTGAPIGQSAQNTGAMFEALNQSGNQFLNRLERSMNSANRGRGRNDDNDAPPPIRVKLKLGFPMPAVPMQNLAAPTADRLNTLLVSKGFAAEATLDGGVAVLTGEVENDGDRRMLEQLAELEPGVTRVDNQLTVIGQAEPRSEPREPELLAPPN